MKNEILWVVEDFIKDAYLEHDIDNLQYGTMVKHLNIDIDDVIIACSKLERNGKIEYQYDVRDKDLNLIESYNDVHSAYNKSKELFGECDDISNSIFISIRLREGYRLFLDKFKSDKQDINLVRRLL